VPVPSIYAPRRPVVNSYLVRERDRRRLRELVWVVVILAPLAIGLLGHIWLRIEQVRVGYRIELLERQLHRSEQNERQLRLEAAYLASPARVGERAAAVLGMGSPTLAQLVFAGEAR